MKLVKDAIAFIIITYLAVTAAVYMLAWFSSLAGAHSFYDPICCNDNDCAPIDASEIKATPDGYLWTNKNGSKLFPYTSGQVKPSPDGGYHGCELPNAKVKMCIYVPPTAF